MKLSLAMIVKNEAHVLGKCLDSAKDLVDELVVVDTGSTDKTVEVALSYGARVEQFAWTGSFAEARNKSLSLCKCDWILVLDADEILDTAEHQIIRQAIFNAEAMGYRLWIKNYLDNGSVFGPDGAAKLNDGAFEPAAHCSHYIPQTGLRLFRAQNTPQYAGRIHESVEQWFEKQGYEAPLLEAAIHHFGKVETPDDLARRRTYLDLARQEAKDYPYDPNSYYNVLKEALILEDWPAVLESAETYLKLKGDAPLLVRLGGAKALIVLGRPNEALEFIGPVDNEAAPAPAVLELKAEAFQTLGMLQEAVDACLHSINIDPNYTAPFIQLYRILDDEGEIESARRILEVGLDQNTRDVRLWESLVGLSSKYRDSRAIQDAWHAIQAVPNGGQGIWHMIVAVVLNGQGSVKEALDVLDMGLTAFPDNTEIAEMKTKVMKTPAR